ncbi:MAG: response regulator, partial [Nitrospira sp.]
MIADDHSAMRNTVVRLLEADFEVLSAVGDGALALEAVTTLRPDVIILDIMMPSLTGIEVAHRLKAEHSNVRIMFLTVIEDADFVREAFTAGGSAYVVKSRLTTDLRVAINEVMAGHVFVSP